MTVEAKILLSGGGNPYADFDPDETMAADSDTRVPTQQAVKAYVDDKVSTVAEYPGGVAAAYIDFNDAGEAGMVVTIDGVEYAEADTADAAAGVWTNGADAADSAASLIEAINGDERATAVPFTAVADETGDGIWLFADDIGADGNVTIETDSEANCTVQNSTGGAEPSTIKVYSDVHTVNTQELLSGTIDIAMPFAPVMVQVQAYSATGAPIYFTDLVTIETSPNRIRITTDGATNLADTNVLHIFATDEGTQPWQ